MPDTNGGNLFPENDREETGKTNPGEPGGGWITPPPGELGWSHRPARESDSVYQDYEDYNYFNPDALEQAPEAVAPKKKKRGVLRIIFLDIVAPLVIAFGVAMIFQATVAKPYQIPSGSMIPTIQDNDRILADRVVYHFESIHRGDVIVFNPPASLGSDTPFVKRVIGLPGDTVEVKNDQVLIDKHDGKGAQPFVVPNARPTTYTMTPETVPPGQLFVLGDNRDESYDSHRWGFVPMNNVIGRAELIYWPLNHLSLLGN